MSENDNFYLSALNIQIEAGNLELHTGEETLPFTGIDAYAELKVPISFSKCFQYLTTGDDVNDINKEDLKFRVVSKDAAHGDLPLKFFNPKNVLPGFAELTSGHESIFGYSSFYKVQKTVAADWPRYQAKEEFTTSQGVDLYRNEREIKSGIVKSATDAFVTVMTDLDELRIDYVDGGEDYVREKTEITDVNGATLEAKQLEVDKAKTFPSRVLFSQLLAAFPDRFDNLNSITDGAVTRELRHLYLEAGGEPLGATAEDKANAIMGAGEDLWRYVPMKVGDKIYFKLAVDAGSNTNKNGTKTALRTYQIKLTFVADDSADVVEADPVSATNYVWGWTDAGYNTANDLYPYDTTREPDETTNQIVIN